MVKGLTDRLLHREWARLRKLLAHLFNISRERADEYALSKATSGSPRAGNRAG